MKWQVGVMLLIALYLMALSLVGRGLLSVGRSLQARTVAWALCSLAAMRRAERVHTSITPYSSARSWMVKSGVGQPLGRRRCPGLNHTVGMPARAAPRMSVRGLSPT